MEAYHKPEIPQVPVDRAALAEAGISLVQASSSSSARAPTYPGKSDFSARGIQSGRLNGAYALQERLPPQHADVWPSSSRTSASAESWPNSISSSAEGFVRQNKIRGCLAWTVVLEKQHPDEDFGYAKVNGRTEFEARLPAPPASPRGRDDDFSRPDADWRGPETLVVRRILEGGLLHQWNLRHPNTPVLPEDSICAINGRTTIHGMLQEEKSSRILLRIVRYPERFEAKLRRDTGVPLGVRVQSCSEGKELLVIEVCREGALPSYNKDQSFRGRWHKVILPDMVIEAANNVSGDSRAMASELARHEEISLRIRRSESNNHGM